MRVTVTINGTDTNPWAKYNLTMNPFPQIGRAEYNTLDYQIRRLDAEPFQSREELEAHLKKTRANPEFIKLCCKLYQKGKRVRFDITFPDLVS